MDGSEDPRYEGLAQLHLVRHHHRQQHYRARRLGGSRQLPAQLPPRQRERHVRVRVRRARRSRAEGVHRLCRHPAVLHEQHVPRSDVPTWIRRARGQLPDEQLWQGRPRGRCGHCQCTRRIGVQQRQLHDSTGRYFGPNEDVRVGHGDTLPRRRPRSRYRDPRALARAVDPTHGRTGQLGLPRFRRGGRYGRRMGRCPCDAHPTSRGAREVQEWNRHLFDGLVGGQPGRRHPKL